MADNKNIPLDPPSKGEYILFGDEWRAEMMKFKKDELITVMKRTMQLLETGDPLIVMGCDQEDETTMRISFDLEDGPWMTYHKGDLPRDPVVGDVLKVRPPKIVGYAND